MPQTVIPEGATVVEEKRTRVETRRPKDPDLPSASEFLDWIESQPTEVWIDKRLSLRLWRGESTKTGEWCRVFDWKKSPLFSREVVGELYGGGVFYYMAYENSMVRWSGTFKIAGAPKSAEQMSAAAQSGAVSETTKVLEMLLDRMDRMEERRSLPENMLGQAYEQALDIHAKAVTGQQMTMADMLALVREMRAEQKPSETPDWQKQLFASLLPLGIGLLGKILEPKDTLATLKQATEIMNTMQGAAGANAQPDLATSIFSNLAPLGDAVSRVLAQLNQAAQIAAQNRLLAAAGEKTQQSVQQPGAPAAAPGPQPPPAQAAAADPRQFTPDQVWTKMVEMCHQDAGGAFAFDFLMQIDAQTMQRLRQANISFEQLEEVVRTGAFHPLTKQMASSPHYQKFLREFYEALMAMPMPGAPPAPQPVN